MVRDQLGEADVPPHQQDVGAENKFSWSETSLMNVAESERRRNLRRSTRVPIAVRLEVQATGVSCNGETVTVNLHGALLKTSVPLKLGAQIKLLVHLTGKSADARVVFASSEEALHFGIALDRPENI